MIRFFRELILSSNFPNKMISEALSGIGVVIDDEVFGEEPENRIREIVSALEKAKVPVLKFAERPDEQTVANLRDVCFLILDWKFDKNANQRELDESGLTLGDELQGDDDQKNIELIKHIRLQCFAPIFIFSNEHIDDIRRKLTAEGLKFENEERDLIFVLSKSDFRDRTAVGNPVIDTIVGWVKRNPAIYLFEVWKKSMSISQSALFRDLYDQAPSWPKVLWSAYKSDSIDPNLAITELMHKNIRARLPRMGLDENLLEGNGAVDKTALRRLVEFSMFIPESSLTADEIGTGDIFRIGERKKIFLNIRCDCDTIQRGGSHEAHVQLYCLEGETISEKELTEERFHRKWGLQNVRDNEHTIFPVLNGRAVVLKFSDIHQKTLADLKANNWTRLGRLTPPIITQIRQRFSLWLQRDGLAKIPVEAVFDVPNTAIPLSQEVSAKKVPVK